MQSNNMFSRASKTFIVIIFLFLVSMPQIAFAGMGLLDAEAGKSQTETNVAFQKQAGFAGNTNGSTLPVAVALVIRVFIGLLGTIFLVLILSAGWNWFMAQGDPKKTEVAKDKMINAVIGLIVVVSAYAITVFVFRTAGDLGVMGGGSTSNILAP